MPWDYGKKEYEKQKKNDPLWHLERLVNYGLENEKINKQFLEKHLDDINVPENRRDFLKLILHGTKSAH